MQQIKKIFKRNEAFSLVELIVAMAVSSIIMIMIYSSYRAVYFSVNKITKVADFDREMNLAYRRLDIDLSCMMYNVRKKQFYLKGDTEDGLVSNSTISFVTINQNNYMIKKDIDSPAYESDLKEVSYYLKKDPQFPEVSFLVRKEYILYNGYNTEIEESKNYETESVILKNVMDIKFEYFDDKWQDDWDSKEINRFPKSVKTTIKIKDYDSKEQIYEFISKIKMVK